MYVKKYVVDITTFAEGDDAGKGTGYTPVVNGRILTIRYLKATTGSFADTVDFDVTTEDSGVVVWDEDDVTASATVLPRQAVHSTAGVASGTESDCLYVANERIKIEVADGGNGKVGQFVVLVG